MAWPNAAAMLRTPQPNDWHAAHSLSTQLPIHRASATAMSDWSYGYVSEIDYTYGYYPELAPLRLRLAMLSKQQASPQGSRQGRPLRYLELGFGQGLSLNFHAAAGEGEFWGVDFNPTHTANARVLADASGADLRLTDDDFAEFARRDDLPEFDVITLHGIWSWISEENRQGLADFFRRKLAVGGVVYLSYNCTPGWSAAMPLRHLLTLHADLASNDAQGLLPKVEAALGFAQQVVDSGAKYFAANPGLAERLKQISGQNRRYLAHEYFNNAWLPMPFSDIARQLGGAKLSFAASANLLDHIDSINLTTAQQTLMASLKNPVLTESLRDYIVNQQFRRDIWVKGPRPLAPRQQLELLSAQRFVLCVAPQDVPLKVVGALGEAALAPEVYQPVIEQLAADGGMGKPAAEIIAALPKLGQARVLQALLVLTAGGHASPAADEPAAERQRTRTDALNRHLVAKAGYDGDIAWLASPVTGAGLSVDRFQQLFIAAIQSGRTAPHEWADHAWSALAAQGECLIKDGATLTRPEDNIAELRRRAVQFAEQRLGTLRVLGVV